MKEPLIQLNVSSKQLKLFMGLDVQLGSSRYLARATSKMLKLYKGIRIECRSCMPLSNRQDSVVQQYKMLGRHDCYHNKLVDYRSDPIFQHTKVGNWFI